MQACAAQQFRHWMEEDPILSHMSYVGTKQSLEDGCILWGT